MKKGLILIITLLALTSAIGQSRKDVIEVRGRVIDILTVKRWDPVFPQGGKALKYGNSAPETIIGKQSALSIKDFEGPKQVRCAKKCDILIALHYKNLNSDEWTATGEGFAVGSKIKYYLFTHKYDTPGKWIDIPGPRPGGVTSIVYADRITVADVPQPPGVVIAKVDRLKRNMVTNPSIAILPNGDYVAACSGVFVKQGERVGPSYFISRDKGKTWKTMSKNNYDTPLTYSNLFVHNGVLYSVGVQSIGKSGNVIIRRSDDGGMSWSYPETDTSPGVIKRGRYHTAPVTTVVHDGRIWRAMETNVDKEPRQAFVMSAPANSDLLKASNWVSTNTLAYDRNWLGGGERIFKQWIEGNVVVGPNGKLKNLMRVDDEKRGGTAALITVENSGQITFNPQTDIVDMPGGGKKFTVRYDPVSDKYWAITNPEFEKDKQMKHSGLYPNGVHCGLIRNNLALLYSDDLRNWTIKDVLISSDNPFFHGFQYVDWQFEGEDIVAVIRTAFEEERGLPVRQHDANMFTFMRFSDFRTAAIPTIEIKSIN